MGPLCQLPRAAVTKYHKLGGFRYRNRFSYSSGGQQSKIKVLAGPHSLWTFRGGSFFASFSFQQPRAFLGLWQHFLHLCLHLHRAAFSLYVSQRSLPLWQKLQSYWIRAHLHDLILTWWNLQRPCFQIKSHSQVQGDRAPTYPFMGREDTIQPLTARKEKNRDRKITIWSWSTKKGIPMFSEDVHPERAWDPTGTSGDGGESLAIKVIIQGDRRIHCREKGKDTFMLEEPTVCRMCLYPIESSNNSAKQLLLFSFNTWRNWGSD